MRARVVLPLLASLVGVAACARSKATGTSGAASSSPPAPSSSASGSPATRASTKPSTERRPMSADERHAARTYAAALDSGRTATRARRYEDAIAAFDRALVAKPGDARALSERGYARLLAKDLARATADLDRALEGTSDPALLGPIHFNLGLVAEERGDADGARVAFARSNAIRPTKAARAKLEGRSACVAVVDRSRPKAKVHASLSAAYAAMRATADAHVPSGAAVPATDAAIVQATCEAGCDGPGPWVARLEAGFGARGFLVVPAGGKVAVHELDEASFGVCAGERKVTLAIDGPIAHVRVETSTLAREWVRADGEPCAAGSSEECWSGCFYAEWTHTDFFVDVEKGWVAASVTTSGAFDKGENAKDPVTVTASPEGTVGVTGGGCAENFALR